MKKSSINGLLALLLMPVYLFLSFVGSEGSLLCFGNDGHVAIEFVEACGGHDSGSGFAESDQIDACGPCTDVHFAGDSAHLKNTLNKIAMLIGPTDNMPMTSVSFDDTREATPAHFPRPFNKNLTNLKSVVLLI